MKYRIVKTTYYDSVYFVAEKKRFGFWMYVYNMGAEVSSFKTRNSAIKAIERDRFKSIEEIEYV